MAIKAAGSTPAETDFLGNNLLQVLRPEDFALLAPHFRLISLKTEAVIYEPGDVVQYAYFPCGPTLLSFMVLLEDGRGVETALVGREGALGGIVSQGQLPAYCRAVVQFPGNALRIESKQLEKAKAASPVLHYFFARYADCLLAQIFQSVACNATHTIEQRAAKWLAASADRTGDDVIPLKQDQLASLLGVGRSYVGRIMGKLRAQGILKTSRGKFIIHDLRKLKKVACNCNELVRDHFDDVLGGVYPHDKN